jgi:hypothetical protein
MLSPEMPERSSQKRIQSLLSVNENDHGTPGKRATGGNDQIGMMKLDGMIDDQVRIIVRPRLRHSRLVLCISRRGRGIVFHIQAASVVDGCQTEPNREVCLAYSAALNAAQR